MLRTTMMAVKATAGFAACFGALTVFGPQVFANTVTYQIVTNEIAAKQTDGSKVEVYRFDPGVWVVNEGDDVVLKIRGVKGHDHPVVLEGYQVNGVVHRNQTTDLRLKANKPGMFHLICTSHADAAHNGPMEGYLIVVPQKHGKNRPYSEN